MIRITTTATIALAAATAALAAPRDVQFRSVDLAAGVIELHNFGTATEDLTGWRFCSHDASVVRRYSAAGGLTGVSLAPGESIYVHFNNDADDPDEINVSAIGGAFAPINTTAYAIQIYFPPVQFGNGGQIADAIQWTANGAPDLVADERTDEAVAGGVWGAVDDFIALNGGSAIRLMDLTGAELQTSASYMVLPALQDCDGNGRDDFFEVLDGTLDPCSAGSACTGDLTGDGTVGSADLAALVAAWGACP